MTKHVFLIVFAFLFMIATPVRAADEAPLQTLAKQAFIMDFDTGTVLFEKDADMRMPTSSMSKVMTVYMVFQALKDGRLKMDMTLPVSEKAWKMGGSKMFVHVGDSVKVEDLLRGVIVQSGNDATIVLAEGLSGSEAAFAQEMNAKAQELGMTNSHFMNASGWPEPEHYSTARDLAILGKHLIADFPEFYHYFAELEYTYNNIKQGNRNPLLYRNVGADGIKTGHTEEAGYGLMTSGTMGGRRVILVVNGLPSDKERGNESARLMEWALKGFSNISLYKAGEPVAEAKTVLGQSEFVPLTVEKDIVVTLPMAVRNDLKVEAIFQEPLKAPLKKGTQAGRLVIDIPRASDSEVPLVLAQDVAPLGFIAGTIAKAKLLIAGGKPRL